MPRKQANDGMEIVYADLSAISSVLELELYDRVLYELMNRQQNIVFGDSFVVTYVNATTVKVKAGNGMYFDNTQVDPEPMTRLLRVATDTNKTLAAADGSNNRIDVISIAPARATSVSQSRNVKDATSGVVTPTSQVVETDWASTLTVTTGTPSGSPAVPTTPAGNIKLAEVLVTAVTGLGSQAGITDKRPRYQKTSSVGAVTSVTATYTADGDDETIFCNATGGAFAVTLPPAASFPGKRYTVIKTDSSANAVTLTGNGSEKISDSNTQALSNQYTSMSLRSNGTQWYLL